MGMKMRAAKKETPSAVAATITIVCFSSRLFTSHDMICLPNETVVGWGEQIVGNKIPGHSIHQTQSKKTALSSVLNNDVNKTNDYMQLVILHCTTCLFCE